MKQLSTNREFNQRIDREMARWPDVEWDVEHGGKHNKMVLRYGGQTRKMTCAVSPSDHRCSKNHVTWLRRTLREMGATPVGEQI